MKSGEEQAPRDEAPRETHDPSTPRALIDFMLTDWAPRRVTAEPVAHAERFRARRETLSQKFPGEVLVVPTGHEKVRSNDTIYPFRPSSDFFYLTGNLEPDCVLALVPRAGGHESLLFVEPVNRDDATFFTDRAKGELWVGPRHGVELSRVRYGIGDCRSLRELPAFLDSLRGPGASPVRVVRGFSPIVDEKLGAHERDAELATVLAELRLIKDEVELAELQTVVDATKRGFEDVIRALAHARSEREVEGTFNLRARVEGNDVGYGTIAASGPRACILHWTRNDGALRPNELLLLDAGIEGNALYTADITRTLPIGGRFTVEQRAIYELVFRAQRAAMEAVRPGADFMEPNRVAQRVLAAGLHALGILRVAPDEAVRDDRQLQRRYTLHNTSHMLGLDVHDCAKARQESYRYGKLKPGMVLTVEPGCYLQADDLTVPEKFRGIGVRIEDDVVVTENGYRNLSASIPAAPDEVEAWMARAQRGA